MKISRSNRQGWIWFAILLVLFVLLSYFLVSQKPKSYPQYVSYSPSPTGVKAFYTYLNNHFAVERWNQSPTLLPKKEEKKLLIIVEPSFIPDTKELAAYQNFMRAGNTILLVSSNPTGMFDLETSPLEDGPSTTNEESILYDQEQKRYWADLNPDIRLLPSNKEQTIFYDDLGAIAEKRSVGEGQLIVSISPEWMSNANITGKDHLPLLLRLMDESKPGSILFDEFIHTGQSAPSSIRVYPQWFLLMLLQAILITILWIWSKGKRFGPIFVPREETVRFSDEGIRALTAWFLRGRRYHDSLLIQVDYVKLLLQERWGIPYSKEWKDSASMLERKWLGMPTSEIRSFLNDLVHVIEKEKVNKQEYLLWSRKLDHLRKEVEG